MEITSLCYIEKDDRWLMLYRNKKKNDPNAGYYIGVGGHLEPGETIDACMIREVREETGLEITGYRKRGLIHFHSDTFDEEEMYLYTATEFTGELTESCTEGELRWIPKRQVLSLPIWEGDRVFLQRLLDGDDRIDIALWYKGSELVRVEDLGLS